MRTLTDLFMRFAHSGFPSGELFAASTNGRATAMASSSGIRQVK
jgi:hypothetical protein